MKHLLAVMIPSVAFASTMGIALVQGDRSWAPVLGLTILLIVLGIFIIYKRK